MIEPLCVSAHSVAESVRAERPVTIWVLQQEFSPADETRLKTTLRPFPNVRLEVHPIDLSAFRGVKGLHGDAMTFARILLPDRMADQARRIVYLDADTLAVGGVEDLFDTSLEGCTIGAVSYEPLGASMEADFYRAQGVDLDQDGFNAGVMAIDVERWRKQSRTDEIVERVRAADQERTESDQPFLNVAFHDDFRPLRIRYNKRASPDQRLTAEQAADGILHFVGIPKPWDIGGKWLHKNYTLYEECRRQASVVPRSVPEIVRDDGVGRVAKGIVSGLRATMG
jgi:lipopolysaccharide biosynthesis glycosyltransferase